MKRKLIGYVIRSLSLFAGTRSGRGATAHTAITDKLKHSAQVTQRTSSRAIGKGGTESSIWVSEKKATRREALMAARPC